MKNEEPISAKEVDPRQRVRRSWITKFSDACRGVKIAVRAEVSFFVHLFVTMIVVLSGAVLGLSRLEWCLIVLCVATTLSAEMFNRVLRELLQSVGRQLESRTQKALRIGTAAVFVTMVGALMTLSIIFGQHLFEMFGG